jgi:hypothetical protein
MQISKHHSGCLNLMVAHIIEADMHAFCGKVAANSGSNAARPAGDKSDFSLKIQFHEQ